MKQRNFLKPGGAASRNAFRGGSYSLTISAVVLAILIVVNIFASSLPTAVTKYDISASKLYSITSNTKVVVNALEQDVTIYWVVQSGEEDEIIENLLGKYDSLSDHIQVVKKNPDVYPTFAEQYTDETVRNNSLIVESGDRSRYIGYNDIYLQDVDLSSYYNVSYSFDGEGAITSAIDYVVSEELPQIYILEGHGEAGLPASFQEQIEKENMETSSLSLLTVDGIPEDADCVMIYAPASDISPEEKELLADYAANGGKLLVAAGPVQNGILENLYGLLADYGVDANEGIVVETDRDHYSGFQGPLALLPDMSSHAITDSLIEENYYPVMPISLGLTVNENTGGGTVTELLTTSDMAYSKLAGYGMTDYEKEDGDIDGPFALAVSIDTAGEGKIVWFTSSYFLEDMYNAASSGANNNLGMNALSSLAGETEAMAIRSKSLNYNYLTISETTASLLKTVMIGVFPLLYLGVGIVVVLRRRRLQSEPV
ncbi:MAG: GldG family protein [Oscillospiraceae bacterium]|nr:GldG family protein [Oscillospiraceae bacterium]